MLFSLPEMPSPGPSFCLISFYLFSNNLSQKIFPLILWFTPYPERNSFLLCVSKILVAASPTLAQEFEEGDCTSSGPHLAYGPHLEHVALALSVLKLSSKVTANNLPSSHPNEHFWVLLSSELSEVSISWAPLPASWTPVGLWFQGYLTFLECSSLKFSFLTTVTASSFLTVMAIPVSPQPPFFGPVVLNWGSSKSEDRPYRCSQTSQKTMRLGQNWEDSHSIHCLIKGPMTKKKKKKG